MKRYEFRRVAALVTLFILLTMCTSRTVTGAPYSPTTGRRAAPRTAKRQSNVINDMQCTETKSYFFRSQCSDNGYLTIHRNRVLVQTTGLSDQHPEAEFAIELCTRRNSSELTSSWLERSRFSSNSLSESDSRPMLRYRHKKSNKYICFSRRGRVRVSTKRRVDSRGSLCMFRQVPVVTRSRYEDKTYHHLQNVHNNKWHLGFNHKKTHLTHMIARDDHKAALPRHGRYFDPRKCDFKFFAGEFRPLPDVWNGIFDLITDSKLNKYVSKAAIGEVEISTNELSADLDQVNIVKFSDKKISKAHKAALRQQQVLNRERQRKIRHFKHKRPRPSRREKNGLKALRRKQPMSKSQPI